MFDRCEYCGHELGSRTKEWKEHHKKLEEVEYNGTIRHHYYSITEDSDEVCFRCYCRLLIKKILIRVISWGFAFFFLFGISRSQGNLPITILSILSLTVGLYAIAYNRSALYSVVGLILSPFLGPCEMHPFGNKYTIRERREDKVPIGIERKIEKVKKYLMKKHYVLDNKMYLSLVNLESEMEENYEKYKCMKIKDLAMIVISKMDTE